MKISLYITLAFYAVLISSCSIHQKTLLSYGTEEKFLLYSDSSFSDGKIILEIDNLKFYFKTENFKNVIIENYDIEFQPFSYLKDFSNNYLKEEDLEITESNKEIYINGTKATFPLSYDIAFILDYLVKKGDFYLEKNYMPVRYIEYKYWDPQYQGTIFSEWIVNKKVVFEFVQGFVD